MTVTPFPFKNALSQHYNALWAIILGITVSYTVLVDAFHFCVHAVAHCIFKAFGQPGGPAEHYCLMPPELGIQICLSSVSSFS